MLFFNFVALPNMISRQVTPESIIKNTTTAGWAASFIEIVAWILVLIGFLRIKRPESPA